MQSEKLTEGLTMWENLPVFCFFAFCPTVIRLLVSWLTAGAMHIDTRSLLLNSKNFSNDHRHK